MNLNMAKKIAVFLGILIAIILGFGIYAYTSLLRVAADVNEVHRAQDRALLAVGIELDYTSAVLQIRRYIGDGVPSYRESALRGYRNALQEEYRLLAMMPDEMRPECETVINTTAKYVSGVTNEFLPIHEQEVKERLAGNIARAEEIAVEKNSLLRIYTSQAKHVQSGLREISKQNEEIIHSKLQSIAKTLDELVQAVFVLFLASFIVAMLLSYRLARSITIPLKIMTKNMDEMAAGNFEHNTCPELLARRDEFGLMAKSLNSMKRNTKDLIAELHENQEQTQALVSASPDLIIRFSGDGRYLEIIEPAGWNPFKMEGVRIGGHISQALPENLAGLFMAAIRETIGTGKRQTFEYEDSLGGGRWIRECRTYKKTDNEVVFIIRDITHRRKVEETLRQVVEGMSCFTGQELFDYLTEYFARTFDVRYCFIGEFLANEEIVLLSVMVRGGRLKPFSLAIGPDQPAYQIYRGNDVIYREKVWRDYPFYQDTKRVIESLPVDINIDVNPSSIMMESYIGVPLKDSSGRVLGIMTIMDDRPVPDAELIIALVRIFASRVAGELERLVNERRIQSMAYTDALTGLPNRWHSYELLDNAVNRALEKSGLIAVIRLDIDNFRYVNDSIGRAEGDKLFVAIAERLQKTVRDICPGCDIARLDGDNFVVVLKNVESGGVTDVTQAIINSLAHPFRVGERDIYLSASFGISMFPEHGITGDELLNNAERALIYVKEHRRGSIQYYDPALQTEAMKKIALLNDLRNAITNEEFILYYQPQYQIEDNRLVGVEALLRWKNPQKGIVAPMDFIPLAESSGLIIPIGEWVLNEACRQLKTWIDNGAPALRVAVNISVVQFSQPGFVDVVRRAIAVSGIQASLLELEITENITMHGVDKVREKLVELSAMGVTVSIDDFGTGYSSLSYLQTFPLSNLKIDRSFVHNLENNQANAEIVSAIIALAHSLNLKVVAEGIETRAELEILQKKTCDIAQGYLLSYPVPAEEVFKI